MKLFQVLYTTYETVYPTTSKSQIWANILKDQETAVARIGQSKSVLSTYHFQYQK